MTKLLLVGFGGFAGAVLRYLVAGWAAGLFVGSKIPLGTLAVNLIGCFLIGFLFRLSENIPALASEYRPLVFTGILGGFTTFSAFGLEVFQLGRSGDSGIALVYVMASVVGGVALTGLGFLLASSLFPVE